MNPSGLYTTWARLADGQLVSSEKASALMEWLKKDTELLKSVSDERGIDAMIRIIAQDQREPDMFVERCIQAGSASTATTGTDVADPSAKSGLEIPINIEVDKTGAVNRRRDQRISGNRFLLAGLATSLLIAGTVGIWWLAANHDQPQVIENPDPVGTNGVAKRDLQATPGVSHSALPNPADNLQGRSGNDPLFRVRTVEAKRNDVDQLLDQPGPSTVIAQAGDDRHPANRAVPEFPGVANSSVGSVLDIDGLKWNHGDDARIVPGPLQIDEGTGLLVLDGGTQVFFTAPINIDVISKNALELREGQFMMNRSAGQGMLEVSTPDMTLTSQSPSEFQVRLDPDGNLEAFVSDGMLSVARKTPVPGEVPVRLMPGQLQQVLLTTPGNSQVPAVNVAQGGRQFLGQVMFANEAIPTTSADDFTRVLGGFGGEHLADEADFRQHWQEFARVVQQQGFPGAESNVLQDFFNAMSSQGGNLPNENKLRDDGDSRSTGFQGSININGQQQSFDSLEGFNRARQQLFGGGSTPRPGQALPSGNAQLSEPSQSVFQGEIDINGQRMNFTSPEQFQQYRDSMKNFIRNGKSR